MTTLLLDHLWQSTWFVLAIALLALVLRRNGAHVRYGLWLAASLKFLVPFSLLTLAGSQIGINAMQSPRFEQINKWFEVTMSPASRRAGTAAPAPASKPAGEAPSSSSVQSAPAESLPAVAKERPAPTLLYWLGAIWLAGAALTSLLWLSRWRRIRSLVADAAPFPAPLTPDMPIPVLESRSSVEPGIAGIFRPVMLLPQGIAGRLSAGQLRAVLAHELAHWRRRDNLTASLHMLVEVVFWFHPLVWWAGAQLIREREHACDEAVLRRGEQPHDYAEGILNVCQYYVAPPLRSAAISGGDLRQRIQRIVANLAPESLGTTRKALLAGFALVVVAAPVLFGALGTTRAAAAALVESGRGALEPLYQAALQEGEVDIMINDPRDAEWLSAAFARTFPGIRIRIAAQLGHLPLVIRDAESRRPTLDLVQTSLMEAHALDEAGLLAENDWTLFDVPGNRLGLKGHFAYTNNFVFTVAYDERRVDDHGKPVTWRDLLDPGYRGVMATNAFVLPRIIAGLGLSWGEPEAERYARALHQDQNMLVAFGDATEFFLDESDVHRYYIGMVSTVTDQWKSQGLPAGYVVPEPVIMEQQGAAVLTSAPHPAAARLLAGWLASAEAKAIRQREAQSADLLPDSNDALAVTLRARHGEIVYDTPETAGERMRLAETFQSIFQMDGYDPYRGLPAPRLPGSP